MNLIEQILAQSSIGSAQGQGFGDYALKGAELAQNRQRINLDQARFDIEKQQTGLRNAYMGAQIQGELLDNKIKTQQLDDMVTDKQVLADWVARVGNDASKILNTPAPPLRTTVAQSMFTKAQQGAANTLLGRSLVEQATDVSKRLSALRGAEAADLNKQWISAGGDVTKLSNPGEFFSTLSKLEKPFADPNATPAIKNMARIKEYQDQIGAAKAAGNTTLANQLEGELGRFETLIAPQTTTVETTPTGGSKITIGAKPSAAEKRENLSEDEAISSLNDAISAIQQNPNAIGVRGAVGSAIERAKGQMSPNDEIDTSVTDTRQKASLAFSRIAKSLRVDSGNMSRYELNKLEQAGDVLDITEAPQTALRKLGNLQSVVVARKLRTLKQQNKSPDDNILKQIPGNEIPGLVSDGILSPEEAKRWYSLKP